MLCKKSGYNAFHVKATGTRLAIFCVKEGMDLMDESLNVLRLQCPDCGEWFDCRDLQAVFAHEHWMEAVPAITCTHVTKNDRLWEFYRKAHGAIVTIKILPEKP